MMTADKWNAMFPVGTSVAYASIRGGKGVPTKTRSEAWELGHGEPVVKVEGVSGGVCLSHLSPLAVEAYDSREDTLTHIAAVRTNLSMFASLLDARAIRHDASKLGEVEKPIFDVVTQTLKGLTYGSDEYKASLDGMKPALDHHYGNNRHHPEHFDNGMDGMTLVDITEAFSDWLAAGKRHADGSFEGSLAVNGPRFSMSPQLVSIFRNTYEAYFKE